MASRRRLQHETTSEAERGRGTSADLGPHAHRNLHVDHVLRGRWDLWGLSNLRLLGDVDVDEEGAVGGVGGGRSVISKKEKERGASAELGNTMDGRQGQAGRA